MTWLMIEHGCHRQLNNERKKKFEEAKKTKRKYIVNVKPRRVIWQKRLPADKVTEDTKQFHELTTSRTTEDEVKQKDQLVGGTGGKKNKRRNHRHHGGTLRCASQEPPLTADNQRANKAQIKGIDVPL